MLCLRDIMTTAIETVMPDVTVNYAFNLMMVKGIHHLMVMNQDRPVGLLSIRDLDIIGNEQMREGLRVEAVMITDMLTASPKMSIQEAANLMRGRHLGCLPIVSEDGELVGLVTISDMLSLLAETSQRLQLISG
jgi:acetoin utilization protein AcuB